MLVRAFYMATKLINQVYHVPLKGSDPDKVTAAFAAIYITPLNTYLEGLQPSGAYRHGCIDFYFVDVHGAIIEAAALKAEATKFFLSH